MSAFLGHIHYWLYRKIQLLVERENLILEKTTKVVDDLAEELHSISVDTYGEPNQPKHSSGKHHRPRQYPRLVG